jgi:hypothetical protein
MGSASSGAIDWFDPARLNCKGFVNQFDAACHLEIRRNRTLSRQSQGKADGVAPVGFFC